MEGWSMKSQWQPKVNLSAYLMEVSTALALLAKRLNSASHSEDPLCTQRARA